MWLTLVHKLITPEHIIDRFSGAPQQPTADGSIGFNALQYLMLAQHDILREMPFVISVIERLKELGTATSITMNLAVAAVHTCRDLVRSHFSLKVSAILPNTTSLDGTRQGKSQLALEVGRGSAAARIRTRFASRVHRQSGGDGLHSRSGD